MRKTILYIALTMLLATAVGQEASVLSTGSWWKLEIATTGIYRLTTANLPQLEGADVSRIGLYGSGGKQLELANSLTPTADLQPIAIEVADRNSNGRFDAGDEVLFYGEATDVWTYEVADRRWEVQRHAYASANYYFLTLNAPTPRRIATAARLATDTTILDYTAVATINNDLTNIYRTGQLWMGEKFSTSSNQRTFTLAFPSVARNIKLRYGLASKGVATSTFNLTTNGLSTTHSIPADMVYGTWRDATDAQVQSLAIALRYTPGESTAEGYLDFIELNGTVGLTFDGGQMVVRNNLHLGGTAAFRFTRCTEGTRVWDVSQHNNVVAHTVSEYSWTDSTNQGKTYIVFDGSQYASPSNITLIANQNLHGCAAADYVVVSHPLLRAQADRIASLHAVLDRLDAVVVSDEEVYNEYSSGKQDPMAIRAFLRNLNERFPTHPPRYLLLMGKATYDPRNLLGHNLSSVVTYETPYSFDDDGVSYASDDMMGYLGSEVSGGGGQRLDVSVGRLPAKSVAEAQHMVDKVEGYMTKRDLGVAGSRGDWRNYVALLADDADPGHPGDTSFVHSSEMTAQKIASRFPRLNIDCLYADAYSQQSGAIGSFYPELKNALIQRMNYGCLLINYIGHGSTHYIGTERYVEPSDIVAYTNVDRLPLFVTSTCSYGYHDLPDEECGAESCLLARGGAVAVVSATRPIPHIERFNTDVILYSLDPAYTIGDALRMAKNRTSVSPCIGIIGDPALHLAVPEKEVVVTHINGTAVDSTTFDTATTLSTVTIEGEIRHSNGELDSDFEGTLFPIVFDRESECYTLANDNPGTEVRFHQQKSILYKGVTPVVGGRFTYHFTVPRDVAFQYAAGKLSHYAVSSYEDASGCYSQLLFGGLDEEADIHEVRPEIHLYLGDTNFRNGGLTDENPTLVALITDSVGINAFGAGLGHDITAVIDGHTGNTLVLNDFYEPDITNSQHGTLRYPLEDIGYGEHTLTLKAWNIWGYSNEATIRFHVRNTDTLHFASLTVQPNPVNTVALFRYETNHSAAITSAALQIYSPQGGLITTLTPTVEVGSYVVGPVRWDTSTAMPGLYLARILVQTDDGKTHQSTAKVIVR